jgi:hypothetical protein
LIFWARSPAATPRSAGCRKSSISRPARLDVGNWKSLELICGRAVHRGFSPNDEADLVAMPAGNPDDVVGVEPFPKGASS